MAIATLEDYSLFSDFGEAMMKSLKALSDDVEKEYAYSIKQSLISDYFEKKI